MPETESNATESRLSMDKFIAGCSQLQEIYSVEPLSYTNIMGEWWQRINDIIYTLGLTDTDSKPVNIAWTVPEPGRKRSPFIEEEIGTKTPDGTIVKESSRISHVAGDGTGQLKAHKFGLIQSVDKLFQRNINTWGSLYEYFYNKLKNNQQPVDLTEMIFGKSGLTDSQIQNIFERACRNLSGNDQGLANSLMHFIEDVIGDNLYDFLDSKKTDPNNSKEPNGLDELLFGTDANGNPLSAEAIGKKWEEMEANGSGAGTDGLVGRANEIVDHIGKDLYDWMTNESTKCMANYGINLNGPHSLQELIFGNWSQDGSTITGQNGEIRETAIDSPSWCQIVAKLKSGGLLTEIYNIVNYLGEPYNTYVDKVNKDKDPSNKTIPNVSEDYKNDDPLAKLQTIGVGQVLYGTKNSKNKTSFETDWIFKEANICESDEEVQELIAAAKDQQKIFDTYNRLAWSTTNDDTQRNDACFPKVELTTTEENGVTVNAVKVDGFEMAYVADVVYENDGEQTPDKVVHVMPYPSLETKMELRLGELPGWKRNTLGILTSYSNPITYKLIESGKETASNLTSDEKIVEVGEWFNIIEDGTYSGHTCKKNDFLVCKKRGSADAKATWKVISNSIPEFAGLNARRVVPSWDRYFEWREVCNENNVPLRLRKTNPDNVTTFAVPQVPYNVGDIYTIDETTQYMWLSSKKYLNCNAGDIIICINARTEDETWNPDDWNRVSKANIQRDENGRVVGFYKWWPTTQIIPASNTLLYDFWKSYTGPYISYINVPLFHTKDEFKNLLPTAAPEEDENDPHKSIWDPVYHEIYYKGSLGPCGKYQELPADATIGTAVRVDAPGTYGGNLCKINDTLVCTSSSPVKWENVHRNLNRNYGYVKSNCITFNYGVGNVDSAVLYILPNTLRTESIKIGSNTETYKTASALSWSSENNTPNITGRLTSLILNKEQKMHTGVSGDWLANNGSGFTLNDSGADWSTMTIEFLGDLYRPYKDNPDTTLDEYTKLASRYYNAMIYSWSCPVYKNETLIVKQARIVNLQQSTGDLVGTKIQHGFGDNQWVIYSGTINETTKAYTIGDPQYAIINGLVYPAIQQSSQWGIMFNDVFYPFAPVARATRRNNAEYENVFSIVKYSTTTETVYRGEDSGNNVLVDYSKSGAAAKALTCLTNKTLSRVERADRTISVKKSWVFTHTYDTVPVVENGVSRNERRAHPIITETSITTIGECHRRKFIDLTTFNNFTNAEKESKCGKPNEYPFLTQDWLKETSGTEILNIDDANNCDAVNYGNYGATSIQTTVVKKFTLSSDGIMRFVETDGNGIVFSNDEENESKCYWQTTGNWIQSGKTTTTETINRPLKMVYYWDLMFFIKYKCWQGNNERFNEENNQYINWVSYNIPNIETTVQSWIKNANIAEGFGIPIRTTSKSRIAEMNSWYMSSENNDHVVKIGTNSVSLLALTSNKKYGNFLFDCTPASYTDDDDNLGVVIAHCADHATGLDNAIILDRWSTGIRLRLNSDITLLDINAKPVIKNLNGTYNKGKTHYAETIYYPIMTDEYGVEYSDGDLTTPYNLASFSCNNKEWINNAMFAYKMYTQHEGPSSCGTTETVYNGKVYHNANGEEIKSTGAYQNVKKSAQTMLNYIKPDTENNDDLNYVIVSRSYSPTDTDRIKNASAYNNIHGVWILPFHTTMTADTYWSKLNVPIQNEIKTCIQALIKSEDGEIPTDSEAIEIFKTVIYPRYQLSTFIVDDFTLDDARKLHHPHSYMATLKNEKATVINDQIVQPNLNLKVDSTSYLNNTNNTARWIMAGYGWLNLYSFVDLNFRTIVERKMNSSTSSYDIKITYKDVMHRLANTDGTKTYKLSTNKKVRYNNDPGFIWHTSQTNNQAYKGDILYKIWKYIDSSNNESYNILAWQSRNGITPVPLVLVRIDQNSKMRTRTYELTNTGDNIITDPDGTEIDFNGVALRTIIQSDDNICKLSSSEPKDPTNYSSRNLYAIMNQLMTSIVSYGYVNCSNPLSEYRRIKFIDTTAGEIYDLANNKIWTPNPNTNDYEIDDSKNYDVEQAIMKKFGIGRFLYNSGTNHMFFTRGDTDSVQKIL